MSDGSPAFERVADELERRSQLSRLETRGTLRLALKEAGLLPKTVTSRSMLVVIERILPAMLARRAVRDAAEVCRALTACERVHAGVDTPHEDSPESVFSRLGGSRTAGVPAPPSSAPRSLPPDPPSSGSRLPPSSRPALRPPSIAPGPDSRPERRPASIAPGPDSRPERRPASIAPGPDSRSNTRS